MLLNAREAQKRLGISQAQLSKLINGKVRNVPPLPCVRIGRQVKFREESIDKWVEGVEGCSADRSKLSDNAA